MTDALPIQDRDTPFPQPISCNAADTGSLEPHACPELADALRSGRDEILRAWERTARRCVPSAKNLTADQFCSHMPLILSDLASAMVSADPSEAHRLGRNAAAQAETRFDQNYGINEMVAEESLLRRAVFEHLENALARSLNRAEIARLNSAIDLFLQSAVATYSRRQQEVTRLDADVEMKFLSFLSHDLNNNLGCATLLLQSLGETLASTPELAEDAQTLEHVRQSLLDTLIGMNHLVRAQRCRQAGAALPVSQFHVSHLARDLARSLRANASQKGVQLVIELNPATVLTTNRELVALVLQNLIGNAIKYSAGGAIRVRDETRPVGKEVRHVLAVSDEGPGIAPEHLARIFRDYQRGETHGQTGCGLGLAIASQAAKILNADLEVESRPGSGTTFRLVLPASPKNQSSDP
jgi:signal transduction histidine kinase